MTPSERVLSSAKFIAQRAKHVSVPAEGIDAAAKQIWIAMQSRPYQHAQWQHPLHPPPSLNHDLLNFSFWTHLRPEEQYAVTFKDQRWTGYWTLCACLHRGVDVTVPSVYASIDLAVLERVFRADPTSKEPIPLLQDRLRVLNESGKVMLEGSFVNCIKAANGSAQALVEILVRDFPSFKDEFELEGRPVQFYKRAQILVADLWSCFQGESLGRFDDIDTITMFADYRVPQALLGLGALVYSDELLNQLGELQVWPSGDLRELEIRGCSIRAVEKIKQKLLEYRRATGKEDMLINSIVIDFFLWDYAKAHSAELAGFPIHFTRSVFY